MLTEKTIDKWKKKFIKELKKQLNRRYALGGGQMKRWKGHSNIDENGDPVGFDCCGGIIYALEETTGIELKGRPVRAFLKTDWLDEIEEKDLQEGDLILVDIPGMKDGKLLRDKQGEIVYGQFNHVMTYVPDGKCDIITTEGVGGDFRINPKSSATTRKGTLKNFRRISDLIFKGTTRYKFMRINWKWLFNWKKKHQA